MKTFYGYIRVSTVKQGEHGVSLQEQRSAIAQYATRNGLEIAAWFEERETAAKQGRRVFTEMLRLLGTARPQASSSTRSIVAPGTSRTGPRSETDRRGIRSHSVNESLESNTRGGRLSADIQAVVAADFIRNLREETRKASTAASSKASIPCPRLSVSRPRHRKGQEIDPVTGPARAQGVRAVRDRPAHPGNPRPERFTGSASETRSATKYPSMAVDDLRTHSTQESSVSAPPTRPSPEP